MNLHLLCDECHRVEHIFHLYELIMGKLGCLRRFSFHALKRKSTAEIRINYAPLIEPTLEAVAVIEQIYELHNVW